MTIVRDESRAQEATDTLYADLYGLEERDGRRRSLFRYFHARSPLASWLRSVVARNFVDGYRADRRSEALRARITEESGSAGGVTPPPADPDRVPHLAMLRQALSGSAGGAGPPRAAAAVVLPCAGADPRAGGQAARRARIDRVTQARPNPSAAARRDRAPAARGPRAQRGGPPRVLSGGARRMAIRGDPGADREPMMQAPER